MKKLFLLTASVLFCITALCQQAATPQAKFQSHKAPALQYMDINPSQGIEEKSTTTRQLHPLPTETENSDFVTIVNIGSSANAFGYASMKGSFVWVNQEINTVTNFHRMGGYLDPGGYSGDLGYDISTDGGLNWTNMIEIYTATDSTGGGYYTDAARYPNHGIYNPIANTDPNEAYVAYTAAALGDGAGNLWSGLMYGRGNIGNPDDTTSHYIPADTAAGIFA